MLDPEAIVAELDPLIAECDTLRKRAKYDDYSDLPQSETVAMMTSMASAVRRLAPDKSHFLDSVEGLFKKVGYDNSTILPSLLGIAIALRADVVAGRTQSVIEPEESPQIALTKLAAIRKTMATHHLGVGHPKMNVYDPFVVLEWFGAYAKHLRSLKAGLPQLFEDVPERPIPKPTAGTDYEGRGVIRRTSVDALAQDIDYILEVRANSELATPRVDIEFRVFISHGQAESWREVQSYIERDLKIPTLELAQEPSRGRTVLQKLADESGRCAYAVVVMTGDDRAETGETRARENVMHEIGYFQGRFGLAGVCLLHEEGTNIPSNIHGLVYVPFPPGLVSAAFGVLARELAAARTR